MSKLVDQLINKINEQNTGFSIMLEVLVVAEDRYDRSLTEEQAREITSRIGEDEEFLNMLSDKIEQYIEEWTEEQ